MQHRSTLLAAALLALASCGAARNPDVGGLGPVTPPPASRPEAPDAQPAPGGGVAAAAGAAASAPDVSPGAAPGRLSVGKVGGEDIDAREFLTRLWMRDSAGAREVFEYLVMSRVALYEAERLGVVIDPADVEATLARARAALEARLAESPDPITLEQHVRRTLEMELVDYESNLRADAIVQLLTERCVRAWYLSNERVRMRLMELEDEASLDRARSALAAGEAFADVARAHGVDEAAAEGGTPMTVVRSESSELARLAFATPVGEVGGPLAQDGRFLLLEALERLPGVEGLWDEIGADVEASLASRPIDTDRLEYVQWRAAMIRRYPIDLEPFLELVRGSAP